jgi:hypothetical protein
MKIFYLLFLMFFCFQINNINAQGCIAVRHMSCANGSPNNLSSLTGKGQFQLIGSYRYFHSFRHFRGDHEERERITNNTQVDNYSHAFDFGISYGINDRWSIAINLPYNINDRSSLYEHYGNSLTANPEQKRFFTNSRGIGDLRLTGTYWLLDPMTNMNGNIAIGLGIKAPTGNDNVIGEFHKLDSDKQDSIITRPVDQSIQLGDGGWGASIEIQGFQAMFKNASLYYSGFYLFSPKVVNRSNFSVPDQYAARIGLSFVLLPKHGLHFNLGGRWEGLPATDAFGSSEGSRRPGYTISIEPGLLYNTAHHTISIAVPVALYRNRIKSYVDKQDPTGNRHGDAAFADYFTILNYAYRF